MKILILFTYIITNHIIICKDIVGKWKRIVTTEDRQIIDSCIQNITSCKSYYDKDVILTYQDNGLYFFQDESKKIEGKYFINHNCDSLGIYLVNNKQDNVRYTIKYTLVNSNLLLLEAIGRHGIISDLFKRIK